MNVWLLLSIVGVSVARPVVVWHGLGDNYASPGMLDTERLIKKVTGDDDTFVYSVRLDPNPSTDAQKSMFGVVNEQIDAVCDQLADIPELSEGFDAVGYSQGGLFLRAYVEKCNGPPVHTLITFGSPHNGIIDLPLCDDGDFLCKRRNSFIRNRMWSPYVQGHFVAAQYFRDPEDMDNYLENSAFLVHVNNERPLKNHSYRDNLASLEKLVLVMFTEDRVLVPKESAWFGEYYRSLDTVTPLDQQELYTEDWIGLKQLDNEGKIHYEQVEADHMVLSEKVLTDIFSRYLIGDGDTVEEHNQQSEFTGPIKKLLLGWVTE